VTEAEPAGTEQSAQAANLDDLTETIPAGSAMLVVVHGPNAGSRFLLDKDVTSAGRHPDSDVFLDDVTVSRRHAEFVRGDSGDGIEFTVRDAGSLNGTYLHRERVDEAHVSQGDQIQIGKFRLVFSQGRK
jgi:pSer/pThr/pTyr-binding forkhead associated (FHA) protein